MTTTTVLDYTSLDFQSLFDDLKRFVQARTTMNVTALDPADPLVGLIAGEAYVGELLVYSANQWVLEDMPLTALRMVNFARAAKTYGFVPDPAVASSVDVELVVDVSGGPQTIAATDKYATGGGTVFQPISDTVVPGGAGTALVTVAMTQGDGVLNEALAAGTGRAGQRYALLRTPVLLDTLVVYVGGVAWAKTVTVALARSTDTVYAVETDEDGVTWVLFGDGINGMAPAAGAAVTASYKTGGGLASNVDAEAIDVVQSTSAAVLSVRNPAAASGGDDAMSLAAAQAALPGYVMANDRAVSDADYASLARLVGGVAKAAAVSGPYGGGGNGRPVYLYLAPSGGGSITATLTAAVQAYLAPRKMANRRVRTLDRIRVELGITIDVTVVDTYSASVVGNLVKGVVADRYDYATVDFGDKFTLQELNKLLGADQIPGVESALVRRFTVLAHMGQYVNFPANGTGVVQTISTVSGTADRREWRVVFTGGSPAAFAVYERILGTITEVSDVAVQDAAADFPTDNALVGTPTWYLVLNPYEVSTTRKAVVGNTQTSVTVGTGDLRTVAEAGDVYAVERQHVATGKALQQTLTGPIAGGTAVLALNASWAVGDYVWITDAATNPTAFRTQITGGSTGAWTISPAVPAAGLTGAITCDAMWVADDGLTQFVVTAGGTAWATGDTFFVDVFPDAADIALRTTDFPELLDANLVVRTIGGKA